LVRLASLASSCEAAEVSTRQRLLTLLIAMFTVLPIRTAGVVDRSGALVDVMFSEHRDMVAAKAFAREGGDPDDPGRWCTASRQPVSQ
jgi:hypothetical protein